MHKYITVGHWGNAEKYKRSNKNYLQNYLWKNSIKILVYFFLKD